jgi:hypothetical protein
MERSSGHEYNDADDAGLEDEDDPTDPRHPDHDLSVSAPYIQFQPPAKPWFTRRLVLILIAIFAIGGLIIPYLRNIL